MNLDAAAQADLVSDMYVLVREESPLWTVGLEITDYYGRGRTKVHGPWSREDCQEVLLIWLDRGWLDLVATHRSQALADFVTRPWFGRVRRVEAQDTRLILAPNDARSVLTDIRAWEQPTPESGLELWSSEEGDGHDYREWRAAFLMR